MEYRRLFKIGQVGQSYTYVDQLGLVSGLEVMKYRRLVEVGQVGHVLALLKLGRVHLPVR